MDTVSENIIKALLSVVQDGISFLSPELDVLYSNPAMQEWYSLDESASIRKCYSTFHHKRTPCCSCPALACMQSGICETVDQVYEMSGKRKGCQRIYCVPVQDESGRTVMLIEYVRDVTNQAKSEVSIELMEQKVQTLLKEIVFHTESQKSYQEASGNTVRSVLRFLRKLLDDDNYLFVKKQLESLTSERGTQDALYLLTPHEQKVARYISEGHISKEIAELMNISKKTVDFHRSNIRRKLNVAPQDDLKIRLQQIF